MKFVCLGYCDPKKTDGMTPERVNDLIDRCLAYDDVLRKGGHFAGGEGLLGADEGRILRNEDGRVLVTDGPFAETREQIGGILILEAKDRDEAVALMSMHPGSEFGPWEIRPAADLTPMIKASEERRRKK